MPAIRNMQRLSDRHLKRPQVVYDHYGVPTTASLNASPETTPRTASLDLIDEEDEMTSPSTESGPARWNTPSTRRSTTPSPQVRDTYSSTVPKVRKSHSRNRAPGHVPRPRNAFIIFRSKYVADEKEKPNREGQQNLLSRQAGQVWKHMSDAEKKPFALLAAEESRQHKIDHPNYVYAPGRTNSPKKNTSKAKTAPAASSKSSAAAISTATATQRRKGVGRASTSFESDSDSESESLEGEYVPPRATRARRAAAQRAVELMESHDTPSPSPSPSPSPESTPVQTASYSLILADPEEDDFVPTEDIPVLDLSSPLPYAMFESPAMPSLTVPKASDDQGRTLGPEFFTGAVDAMLSESTIPTAPLAPYLQEDPSAYDAPTEYSTSGSSVDLPALNALFTASSDSLSLHNQDRLFNQQFDYYDGSSLDLFNSMNFNFSGLNIEASSHLDNSTHDSFMDSILRPSFQYYGA